MKNSYRIMFLVAVGTLSLVHEASSSYLVLTAGAGSKKQKNIDGNAVFDITEYVKSVKGNIPAYIGNVVGDPSMGQLKTLMMYTCVNGIDATQDLTLRERNGGQITLPTNDAYIIYYGRLKRTPA